MSTARMTAWRRVDESPGPIVARVDVPALSVSRVDQTYRRLGPLEWEDSDVRHGACESLVDGEGFVDDDAGIATRMAGGAPS